MHPLVRCPPPIWPIRWLLAAALAASSGVLTHDAGAAEEQEIEAALRLLDEIAYEKAAARFKQLLDPAAPPCPKAPELTPQGCRLTDPVMQRRARGYYAIALHGLKRRDEAKKQFKQLLLDYPTFSPSPAEYPPEVIQIFTEAKKEVEDEITAKTIEIQKKQKEYEDAVEAYERWIDETEKLAKTETVVAERSRLIAAFPFGVGQFQNGNVALGALFFSLETAFLGLYVGAEIASSYVLQAGICDVSQGEDCGSFNPTEANDTRATLEVVGITGISLLAASMIAGIIEAQVNFAGEAARTRPRTTKPRPPKPVPPPRIGVTGVPGAPEAYGLGLTIGLW